MGHVVAIFFGMAASGELLVAVDRAVVRAEDDWPEFRLPAGAFRDRLLAIVGDSDAPVEALARLFIADLYLAHACAERLTAAVEAFAERYLSRVAHYVRDYRDVNPDEVRRQLEDTLLLGNEESGPRIAQYAGRGALGGFVRTAARNAAITLTRRAAPEREIEIEEIASVICSPPESTKRVVTSRYNAVIQEAVRAALWTLGRRQRTVVRLHLTQGVSLTQIGKMFSVNQSTVSRWLQAAIEHLYAEIRRAIREAHGVTGSELDSIVRDVRSQIDLSLSRVLRDTPSSS
jgi:RNA polymerase sigma-70 factor (ECF subfamily)